MYKYTHGYLLDKTNIRLYACTSLLVFVYFSCTHEHPHVYTRICVNTNAYIHSCFLICVYIHTYTGTYRCINCLIMEIQMLMQYTHACIRMRARATC